MNELVTKEGSRPAPRARVQLSNRSRPTRRARVAAQYEARHGAPRETVGRWIDEQRGECNLCDTRISLAGYDYDVHADDGVVMCRPCGRLIRGGHSPAMLRAIADWLDS